MKRHYMKPLIRVVNIDQQDIICSSYNYIDVEGEEGEELPAPPPPSRAFSAWNEW